MIIDCISDLHGYFPKLDGGDLLIVGGDLTANDRPGQYDDFLHWLSIQKYTKKILIAGNHDNTFQTAEKAFFNLVEAFEITYLCDSGTEFEGLKIWGSPWTERFEGMNPQCMAFTCKDDYALDRKWALIPNDTDILITHGPMYTMFDIVRDYDGNEKINVGSKKLWNRIVKKKQFPNLRLHICGHIHEYGGSLEEGYKPEVIQFVNASIVDERYEHVNKPVRVVL